jgi:hypothetical protein
VINTFGTPKAVAPTGQPPIAEPVLAPALAAGAGKSAPPRWAAALVAVVLVLAAVLAGNGTPIGVVLEVLAGAGYIGTEIVRRLNGA